MSPIQTLQEIYATLAEIKLWACDNPTGGIETDVVQTLPYLNNSGGVETSLVLQKRKDLETAFNGTLGGLSFLLLNAPLEYKQRIIDSFDLFIEALEAIENVPLPVSFIDAILVGLLGLFFPLRTNSIEASEDLAEGYGIQQITIPANVKKLKLEIIEYPEWVGKEFYYFTDLPANHELLVRNICFYFFYSSKYNAYLGEKKELYHISRVVEVPPDADRLLIWAFETVRTKVTGFIS